MAKFSVKVRGQQRLNRELERLAERYPEAAGRALHAEAVEIFNESQRLVPEDTQALKESGHVSGPERRRDFPLFGRPTGTSFGRGRLQVLISYGSPQVDYAVLVHEGPQKNWQKPGASNKFLERPAKEAVQGMEERLAARIRDEVKL